MNLKILLLSILTITFMSCMTDRQIIKNRDHILTVLEVKSNIVYKDTTIYKDRIVNVPLPRDTARIDQAIIYDKSKGEVKDMPAVSVKNGLAGATAWIDKEGLHVRAFLTAEVTPVLVHDTIKLPGAIKETVTTYPVKVDVPHGWYTKLALWVFSIQLILVLVFVAWKVLPKFFPQLKLLNFLKSK